MASVQALSNAAQDRKARLAQLKSLKRKQPDTSEDLEAPPPKSPRNDTTAPSAEEEQNDANNVSAKYLSGRNYDPLTRGAKLGFEAAPSEGKETLEKKAAALALETKLQAEEEEKADKPLDLFKLQPRKPNWDLKRDLDRKLDVLNVRTDNAIARLVRERIRVQQEKAAQARLEGSSSKQGANGGEGDGDDEAAGIEGSALVSAALVREREAEEEARLEREEEAALLDGS